MICLQPRNGFPSVGAHLQVLFNDRLTRRPTCGGAVSDMDIIMVDVTQGEL